MIHRQALVIDGGVELGPNESKGEVGWVEGA